jgi:hypothetical protein
VASFEEQSDQQGFWYKARGERGATLFLHRFQTKRTAPFTVYWHGRTRFRQIEAFVEPYFTQELWTVFRAVTFHGRGTVDHRPPNPGRLLHRLGKSLSPDTRFIRLECFQGDTKEILSSVANLEPSAVVWSRLDLDNVPLGTEAPDEIGVCLKFDEYERIAEGLTYFVSKTHIPKITRDDAVDCLHTLAQHLPPDYKHTHA